MTENAPTLPPTWRQFLKDAALSISAATVVMLFLIAQFGLVTVEAQEARLEPVEEQLTKLDNLWCRELVKSEYPQASPNICDRFYPVRDRNRLEQLIAQLGIGR